MIIENELTPEQVSVIKQQWQAVVGDDYNIVVSNFLSATTKPDFLLVAVC